MLSKPFIVACIAAAAYGAHIDPAHHHEALAPQHGRGTLAQTSGAQPPARGKGKRPVIGVEDAEIYPFSDSDDDKVEDSDSEEEATGSMSLAQTEAEQITSFDC